MCAPAFGSLTPAPSTGGFNFGTTTPSAPSFGGGGLFGSTASKPPLFGATTPSFGASSGSLFGPSTTPSLFGGGGSLFGATTSTSLFGGGGLGTPSATPLQQQLMSQPLLLSTQTALPEKEIETIIRAYEDAPSNPHCAFRHLFLNLTDVPARRPKPDYIDDATWRKAIDEIRGKGPEERDLLWPFPATGFKDLLERAKLQDEAIASDAARLAACAEILRGVQRRLQTETRSRVDRCRERHREQCQKLLRVMRSVEALELRSFVGAAAAGSAAAASATGGGGTMAGGRLPSIPLNEEEQVLAAHVDELAREVLHQNASTQLQRRVDALSTTLAGGGGDGGGAAGALMLEETSLQSMQRLLANQTSAVQSLVRVLKRDVRNLKVMRENGMPVPVPASAMRGGGGDGGGLGGGEDWRGSGGSRESGARGNMLALTQG
eukprot:jgi/Mesvir1/7387/Mv19188-RA.1